MVIWHDIDTLLLDMDGTLLDLHFDNHFWLEHLPKRYAEEKLIPHPEAQRKLMDIINTQRGHLNWYCLDFWSHQLGLDILRLKEEVQHLIRFHPHVENFLKELNNTPIRLIMVTNAHRQGLELKQKHTQIEQYFDRIISAHDFKIPKENPDFWRALNKTEPFNPDRTLLIDDNLAILESAKEYGIKHLLTVQLPDSQKDARTQDQTRNFTSIQHFKQITPNKE